MSDIRIVDRSDVVEMLTKIAQANPGHAYSRPDWDENQTGCSYVHRYTSEGEFTNDITKHDPSKSVPGCIIGKMLIEELGVPMNFFDDNEQDIARILFYNSDGTYSLDADINLRFTGGARMLMQSVQVAQDRHCPWAAAVNSHI